MSKADAPWYLVMEDWHPHLHLGLDGIAWPLEDGGDEAAAVQAAMEPLPLAPGGCLFDGCFDEAAARAYFDRAARVLDRVYLVAVAPLDAPFDAPDGLDMGRPNGGFSVIGQDICKTDEGYRRFGHLLNALGLFPDARVLRDYLDDRERRFAAGGLEYLDESEPVQLRVLARTGRRAP